MVALQAQTLALHRASVERGAQWVERDALRPERHRHGVVPQCQTHDCRARTLAFQSRTLERHCPRL